MSAQTDLGREPPHSVEMEEYLLSCCLLDGGDTLTRAIEAGITPAAFYLPANRRLFDISVHLHGEGKPVAVETLAEELRSDGELDAIGGMAYLLQVSERISTTAEAAYFIKKVRGLHRQREALSFHAEAAEQLNQADAAEVGALLGEQCRRLELLADSCAGAGARARPLMDLTASDDERKAANLLGDGFLRRQQGLLLPGATGIGKSSLVMQAAILWALDRPFFGIRPQGPLTSLIVQAENDSIDLVEIREGICAGLDLNADARAVIGRRVHMLTAYERGAELFRRLDSEVKRLKPDLLVIDPLFAYLDGAVRDQEVVTAFLRGLLQPFIVKHNLAVIVLHHSNKPPSGKEKVTWQAGDFAYAGSGSIEFANWARAVIVLRSVGSPTVFELMLPKRGLRAGVCDAEGSPVISQYIQHSKRAGVIFWEPATAGDVASSMPDRFVERLFKAFYGMKRSKDGSVTVAALASRLEMSGRNLNRKFSGSGRLSLNGETLRRDGGRIVLDGGEE